jgi:D-serine deaminase-like pyridoxal phosphate-dependent protein
MILYAPEIQPLSDKEFIQIAAPAPIAILNKGLGAFDRELEASDIAQLDWNLLREDLSLPSAVLYEDRLLHNLNWMRQFISAYGVKLAPHGKTTMAPKLFQLQLQAGAWGITLATAHQTQVAYAHGVHRILMANQLIGKQNMAAISALLRDPEFEFHCLVDSTAQIEQLGRYFADRDQRLNVLLELGVDGGRTGVRSDEQLNSALAALSRWSSSIALTGIEIYEGVLDDESSIRALLQHAVDVTHRLATESRFQRAPILLSGAGSAWYDVVADVFSSASFGDSVEIVLRPGCYLTHDVGAYQRAQARILKSNPIAQQMHAGLLPALHLWAYVQSIPESGRAIVGMGKRDASFDSGLPVPALHYRPGNVTPLVPPSHWVINKMMDQHAFLQIRDADDIRVGDMIGFDICHPCLTFDKWRTLPILNADFRVIDIVQTFF